MCGRYDDPTQHDLPEEDTYLTDLRDMLEEAAAALRLERLREAHELRRQQRADTEAVLRADRDPEV
jgi:hypothetical protein